MTEGVWAGVPTVTPTVTLAGSVWDAVAEASASWATVVAASVEAVCPLPPLGACAPPALGACSLSPLAGVPAGSLAGVSAVCAAACSAELVLS